MQLLRSGEVADRLCIAPKTAKSYLKNTCRKRNDRTFPCTIGLFGSRALRFSIHAESFNRKAGQPVVFCCRSHLNLPPIKSQRTKVIDGFRNASARSLDTKKGAATLANPLPCSVPGAGIEPARCSAPRDFKSLASTYSATRAILQNSIL